MNRREFGTAVAGLSILAAGCSGNAEGAAGPAVKHPRLLVSADDWASLAARRAADPDLARFHDQLLERARKDISLPLLERKLEGRRLLSVSREFIRRVLAGAFAYRVTGEDVFLERARREMLAVAAFSDWNPSHYLDVAEMTAGMAIGYDWLFDDLSADTRRAIRQAIIDKGIAQARYGHKTFKVTNNWNQVCIGGMVLGALAVQEDAPDLAADLLAAARGDVLKGLDAYAPDGVYPEGPAYWSYGTSYSVLLVAALRTCQMADWGVLAAPGFVRSAEFYAHSIGPSAKHFNFADGGEGQELPSPIVYLARELNQPAYLLAKGEMIRKSQGLSERFAPLSVLWWPTRTANPRPSALAYIGQGPQPVAIWRSAWDDPNALWFAIKGGGAAHNHGHMDAGSFVLDQDGVRWARDLGMQDYLSLESRGIDLWNMKPDSPRWQVFRLASEAHNTLTLSGRAHSATAMARLHLSGPRDALIDFAQVLGVRRATRRAQFFDDAVMLDDEIAGASPGTEIRWAMCTEAQISLAGKTAILTQHNKTLHVRFTGDVDRLEIKDISQPRRDFDHPNPNTRQLVALAKTGADTTCRISARFTRA